MPESVKKQLRRLCLDRSKGTPLQYILGDQPFGDLSIVCRKHVLIPRPETETWVTHLATHVRHNSNLVRGTASSEPLRVLDLCTGTGCIPLLLFSLLHRQFRALRICGVDISPTAVHLARRNLLHNSREGLLPASASSHIDFVQGDVLSKEGLWKEAEYDVVVSNPPYVSPAHYARTTTRSVRNYEPKLALVPECSDGSDELVGDAFYPRVVSLAQNMKAKILVMEVGSVQQARRVVEMVGMSRAWEGIEIWKDGVSDILHCHATADQIGEHSVIVRGSGVGRAVVLWADAGVSTLRKSLSLSQASQHESMMASRR
ncbi:MAG: hypothetical protein L6R36_005608 [Xanthoria steineri]|nr:MAG: hypothetical protein L6R36_005608 [Xanthoria steineri]